jgi:hypothetical protein
MSVMIIGRVAGVGLDHGLAMVVRRKINALAIYLELVGIRRHQAKAKSQMF